MFAFVVIEKLAIVDSIESHPPVAMFDGGKWNFAALSAVFDGGVVVVVMAAAAAAAATDCCCCKCAPSIRIIAYDVGDVLVSAAPAIKTEAAKKYA